jgi:hypothetical protein
MGNKRIVEGGSAVYAGKREGGRVGERGPIQSVNSGYAVIPLGIRMLHGGSCIEYPLTVEAALAISADLTRMALWELRKK